jgi:hypothetical protein
VSDPQPNAPPQSRTLSGRLAKTPAPRLLVSAATARVTGTLDLTSPDETISLTMVRGLVTKVKTSGPVAYLGSILYQLGYLDTEELNDSLRELARTRWLHGEILLTRALISPAQLVEGLHEQTTRKLVHLFSLPPETTYSFEADADRLASFGGGDWPSVDPIVAVWRGVRDGLASQEVDATLARARPYAFRLASTADTHRCAFSDGDLWAIECIRSRALSEVELIDRAGLEPSRARALLYFLLVTKQAEATEISGIQPAYRPSQQPAAAPNTRPTVREMAAVGSAPRISVASPEQSESGRWRAVAPSHASSAKMPAASQLTLESGRVPVAQIRTSSSPPRITMGGVEPTIPPSRRANLTPPQAWMVGEHEEQRARSGSRIPVATQAAPSSVPPRRSLSPVSSAGTPPRNATPHPSTSTLDSKVIAELAARRQSIFERARSILKEDHFQRLSLMRDASVEQADMAFQALRTLWDASLLPPALDEAKDDAAFVMSCLAEAHAVLSNESTRAQYLATLARATMRPPTDLLEDDLAASGVTDAYEGAQVCFLRGDLERAERLCKRAMKANVEAGGPLALYAWIDATKAQNTGVEETRKRIAMLDRAVRLDDTMTEAFYWRGQLHKRIENHSAAMRDFRKVLELSPKHLEAIRELRVYEMRIRRNSISMKAVK